MTDDEEFGVELGLQTPVVFQRGIFPAPFDANGSTISYSNATNSNVGPGVTVSGTTNPTGQPGFAFNAPSVPPSASSQSLTNLPKPRNRRRPANPHTATSWRPG